MTEKNVFVLPPRPREIKVSIDLKSAPQSVAQHAGKEPDDAIDTLVSTARLIPEAADKIKATCEAILANEMATSIKNEADARNTALSIFQNVAGKLDAGWQRTEKLISQLEANTMPPAPKDAVSAIKAGHVYAALRSMPPAERGKAVLRGSPAFAAAALTCEDEALTGIFPEQRAALLHEWRRKHHAPTLARIERLRAALTDYHKNCAYLRNLAWGVCADRSDAIEAAEKSQQAALEAMTKAKAS